MTQLAAGLHIHFDSNICRLRFSSASTKNAISFAMAEALGALSELSTSGESQLARMLSENQSALLVLESETPNIFVSGGHLSELANMSQADGERYTHFMRLFCRSLSTFSVPSLSLLSGPAYGGGTELALATDFRAATSHQAALHFWQTRWAVPGGWNGMARLSQIVPAWNARRVGLLFMMQASLGCADLLRFGIVDFQFQDHTAQTLQAELQVFAQRILQCPPELRCDLANRGQGNSEIAEADAALFSRHWLQPEHRTRLAQFLKKPKTES